MIKIVIIRGELIYLGATKLINQLWSKACLNKLINNCEQQKIKSKVLKLKIGVSKVFPP